jgi:hypothetical protein
MRPHISQCARAGRRCYRPRGNPACERHIGADRRTRSSLLHFSRQCAPGHKPLKAWTQDTILSTAKLVKQYEEIRVRGYATDESEFLDGVRCIAAPIRDSEGAVIASIGISAPAARFPAGREKEFAEQVTAVAAQISKLIGLQEE